MFRRFTFVALLAALAAGLFASAAFAVPTRESVGKLIFYDTGLSSPAGQSCASCHDPAVGYADPDSQLPVSQGAIAERFGNRNSPTASYARYIPALTYNATLGTYVGGLFWDGRAASLEAQAKGPFLNPLEMHVPTKQAVISRLSDRDYAADFLAVFGSDGLSLKKVDQSYDNVAAAIAAYERTNELSPFSSKHDLAMTRTGPARMMTFTMAERQGMMLFNGKAQCSSCHVTPMSGMGGGGMGGGGMGGGGMGGGGMGGGMGGMMNVMPTGPVLFSDYRYANLGIPKNWESPFLTLPPSLNRQGASYVDHGLAAVLPGGVEANPQYDGMFRTPSLRNVALTAPYGHNGYFKTLKEIVHFYNTRDTAGAGWPQAEVPATVESGTLGNLGLTDTEENNLVAVPPDAHRRLLAALIDSTESDASGLRERGPGATPGPSRFRRFTPTDAAAVAPHGAASGPALKRRVLAETQHLSCPAKTNSRGSA